MKRARGIDEILLGAIQREMIFHFGKANAITAAALAAKLGIDDNASSQYLRKHIRVLVLDGLPISSSGDGYFMALPQSAELRAYADNLRGRIKGIQQRLDAIESML